MGDDGPDARAPEDLPAPTRYVVTMVHGTFARKAAWVDPESDFSRHLRAELGTARIEPFRWSGANDVWARSKASRDLRAHLRELINEDPEARHCLIAHSHGGNVVLDALSDPQLADDVCGVVTLATPFLSAREAEPDIALGVGEAVMAALFTGFGVFALGAALGHGREWWWVALIATVGILAVLGLADLLRRRMQRHARNVCRAMPATALGPAKLCVIRTATDEAAGTLAGARVAGVLVGLMWGLVSNPVTRLLRRVLGAIDYGGVRRFEAELDERWAARSAAPEVFLPPPVESEAQGPPAGPSVGQVSPALAAAMAAARHPVLPPSTLPYAVARDLSGPSRRDTTQSAVATVIGVLPALVFTMMDDDRPLIRWLGLITAVAYGVPAILALLLAVLSVPAGVLVAGGVTPCGWTLPLAGPFLDIAVEPTPPGTWSVTQLRSGLAGHGLSHTKAHDDPDVYAATAEFLRTCATSTAS